jgi:serine/threonine-protein kinase
MSDETITLTRPGSGGAVATDLLLPRRVGSVRLLRELGQGGMGAVWLGHDELLGRDVAVKFLAGAIAAPNDPGFATFLEGARAAAAVQHGCLNTIHVAGLVEGGGLSVPYLVMQYVDGPTLAQVLKRCGRLNTNEALVVLGAICQGVGQLHDRGIVHRDIKPSNILLDGQGRVIVTDFGLSHRRHAAGAGGVAGTPIYMAPEMFQGEVSLRSDVYALGITAYELLAGAPPFKGTLEEISAQHANAPLPFEPLRSAGIAEAIFEVLERATHKSAVFRHKSARQFWRAVATTAGFKEDPTKGAAVVAQLVARESGQAPSAATRPADETPSPKSFYDTVGAIAQAKRVARTAAEPWRQETMEPVINAEPPTVPVIAPAVLPPPPPLPPPQCGTPDITEQQPRLCAALPRHPRRLHWRFLCLGVCITILFAGLVYALVTFISRKMHGL